jgi:hypothetical protein
MTSWVVGYVEYLDGPEKFYATFAESAQEAADTVRRERKPFGVLEVFEKVKNWK